MPLFPPPTADDIIDDSRLRAEQVSARFVTQDVIDDVTGRLPSEIALIETMALNMAGDAPLPLTEDYFLARFPNDVVADENERLNLLLTDAAKSQALYDLFNASGQLQKAYPERAQVYKANRDTALMAFKTRMEFILGTSPIGEAGGSVLGPTSSSVGQVLTFF